MTAFYFLIGCLATYRISLMLVKDVGPWRIFAKIRSLAHFTKLLTCMFCTSIWVGAIFSAGFALCGVVETVVAWICIALSFSATTICIDRVFTADYQPK